MKRTHLPTMLTPTGLFERLLATDVARAKRLMAGTAAFFLALFIIPGRLGIRWNASPSLPIGIYIESAGCFGTGRVLSSGAGRFFRSRSGIPGCG